MYQSRIFLTVIDMMKLMKTNNYEAARRRHAAIRSSIARKKQSLTIREFCRHEAVNFAEIWTFLRHDPPPQ